VQSAAERNNNDTLVLMTADHSFDLRIKGEDAGGNIQSRG